MYRLKENIERFLDEFMSIEYRGRNHIIAREHYREVFRELLPRYIENDDKVQRANFRSESDYLQTKNFVIIGAGYGGLTAALRLEKLLRKHNDYKIYLIDKNPYHTIKTQLHEAAVRNEIVTIPLNKIIRKRNIQFHLGEVSFIDVNNKIIHLSDYEDKRQLRFDYLVIAIGSKVNYYNIPGMKENSFVLQTLQDAEAIYNHISKICASAASESDESKQRDNLRFVIGGGGLSGVEFAGELADHASECVSNFNVSKHLIEIIIVEAAERLMPFMDQDFSMRIEKKLVAKGIKILKNSRIIKRTGNEVYLKDGNEIKTKNFIWTGGIRVSDLLKNSGLITGPAGRVMVNEYLQAKGDNSIYAIGDSANAINPVTNKPVPTAAQFALQQGRLVAKNIYTDLNEKNKTPYYPEVFGEVVSLGKHLAIGWLALPFIKKITFVGFLGRLLKAAIREKHLLLLRKESRNWITY